MKSEEAFKVDDNTRKAASELYDDIHGLVDKHGKILMPPQFAALLIDYAMYIALHSAPTIANAVELADSVIKEAMKKYIDELETELEKRGVKND